MDIITKVTITILSIILSLFLFFSFGVLYKVNKNVSFDNKCRILGGVPEQNICYEHKRIIIVPD
jgi:hypothetical protein